jgi:hypothetical protein
MTTALLLMAVVCLLMGVAKMERGLSLVVVYGWWRHGTLTVVSPGAVLQLMGKVGCVLMVAHMER